jgi:hypothetical protein
MDLSSIALAVDARVFRPPSERDVAARLYGVRLDPGTNVLGEHLLEKGDAKRILRRTRAPGDLLALALAVAGWRAPMEADGTISVRPSQHPERQRIHSTSLVAGAGELLTVLRTAGEDPSGRVELLPGGEGVVPDLLRACWLRRRCSLLQ